QANASASASSASPPTSVAALLASLPSWSASTSLYSGFGYDDNVVLSHADEERSAFALGGFDALLLHTPRRWMDDYSFYLSGEGKRFFSSGTVTHEAQAGAVAEWRFAVRDILNFSLDLRGYYQDKVYDLSETDVRRIVAELRRTGGKAGP